MAPAAPAPPTEVPLLSGPGHEVVVLGGGPAGCAAATLLARRGHEVALVRPERPPAAALAESIPPSARRILDELGMLDAVERAGLHPNRGNTVWWAGEPVRSETFEAEGCGFHTDRGRLEEVLGAVAEQAGVRMLNGFVARSAEERPDGWYVRCERGDDTRTVTAPWIIDATGRHGLLARSEGREPDRSTTTLALVGRWRRPGGWGEDRRGHTLVESYADGWAWSVPLDDEVRCFTAMIDQRHADLAGPDVDALLEAELAKTRFVGASRTGASREGSAWACPASLYTASRFARRGLLLAGDAGSFIDPLSSFGVKKALSSGWLAGIAVHTALVDPALADTAVDFFDRREREVYRSYRRVSATFFEGAAAAHDTPYWRERADAARREGEAVRPGETLGPGEAPRPGAGDFEAQALPGDLLAPVLPEAEVRRAFEEIRTRTELRAVAGSTLRTVEQPGIDGHRIVLQDHLVSERLPGGVRFVRGVDLRRLIEVAPLHAEVPDGWSAYNGIAPPVTLPDYLTALATAFAAGFLEHDGA